MVINETHGVGRALDVLSLYDRLRCNVIGLQETRRSAHLAFTHSDYLVYCSGECGGDNGEKKRQGGVGLAVRTSITRTARPDRWLKVTFNYVVEPRPSYFLRRMPQLKHRMLAINMHFGRPWTELWRRYLNTKSVSC